MRKEYWTLRGLFNGVEEFYTEEDALKAFNKAGTTWDEHEIYLVHHKICNIKSNPSRPQEI